MKRAMNDVLGEFVESNGTWILIESTNHVWGIDKWLIHKCDSRPTFLRSGCNVYTNFKCAHCDAKAPAFLRFYLLAKRL